MNTEKKIAWTTKSGKKASVRISFSTSRTVDADGERCEVACCELHIVGEVAGMGVVGYAISRQPVTVAGDRYPASIGKLVIPAAQLAEIDAILDEIHATPEWQAKGAAAKAALKADTEYAAHREQMRKVMGY